MKKSKEFTVSIVKDILNVLKDTNRNIIGEEYDRGLEYLKKFIDLKINKYKTGAECWTWNIPQKWIIKDGYIKSGDDVVVSLKECPLHVMSYSTPINKKMRGEELLPHIHVHKTIPEAIPYEFSYYQPKWGFCLTHKQKEMIEANQVYDVKIDSALVDGHLSVGEYTVQGTSDEHIYFLSHLDHPCQVNDGLMGCAVNVALANLLKGKELYYNYTFLFLPETIGSLAYLSHNEEIIPKIRYSIFTEMVGLENPMILQKSFQGHELINKYALYCLNKIQGSENSYPFMTVASNDEKIFDSAGVNIPGISITRINQENRLKQKQEVQKKSIEALVTLYPEYHSNLDNLDTVNYDKVFESVQLLQELCSTIENDFIPVRKFKGPVFLSKYNLWIDWRSNHRMNESITLMMNYLEGKLSVFQLAEKLDLDFNALIDILNKFYDRGLIKKERIAIGFDR